MADTLTRHHRRTVAQGQWKRTRRICWTNWTFGPWYSTFGVSNQKQVFGVDFGPLAFIWERRVRRG